MHYKNNESVTFTVNRFKVPSWYKFVWENVDDYTESANRLDEKMVIWLKVESITTFEIKALLMIIPFDIVQFLIVMKAGVLIVMVNPARSREPLRSQPSDSSMSMFPLRVLFPAPHSSWRA